ncbi:MAG: TetR/AcrR family transcriptional regulator [Sphingomonadales bacterium]|nr:TetR/AcrR family transcriptional regulator [Sphingomonadales bacterium]
MSIERASAATGRKLGRKGLETRERILQAMLALVGEADGPPVTLTSVARAAEVRLPNLYLYFPDFGALVLAALDAVMATAEFGYLDRLRRRWPDDGIEAACHAFLTDHLRFWQRNARLLHMRNALADANDLRVLEWRTRATRPLIELLVTQMDVLPGQLGGASAVATVLMTGIERLATVITNPNFALVCHAGVPTLRIDDLIAAEAEVIAGAMAQRRRHAAPTA